MSYRVPLRDILTSVGQADYTFPGDADDGSTFGRGQKVVVGPFLMTNQATTPASNAATVYYGGLVANPATGPGDWVAPYAGKVVAGSVQLGTAFLTTTGAAKFLLAINGTTKAFRIQPSIGAGNLTKTLTKIVSTNTTFDFNRGDRLGIRFTSASTVNPATVEAYVSLVVEI